MHEAESNTQLARYWRATWTNLVALAFCAIWLVVTQVVALTRLTAWIFTLPVRLIVGPMSTAPAGVPPKRPPPPPSPTRRSSDRGGS